MIGMLHPTNLKQKSQTCKGVQINRSIIIIIIIKLTDKSQRKSFILEDIYPEFTSRAKQNNEKTSPS
jgi:hypothetical protein